VDATGRPVAGATLELWAATTAIGSVLSDSAGAFDFGVVDANPPLILSARRIGFKVQTVDVRSPDTAIVVQMDEQPVALSPLRVLHTPEQICPNREDPRARALWEAMRSRYWQDGDDAVLVFGLMEVRRGIGDREAAYTPGAGRTSAGWTEGGLVTPREWSLTRTSYAHRITQSLGERHAFWSYRMLDQGTIQDFTQIPFGMLHTMSLVGVGAGESVLGFCPRERLRQRGQIEGVLVLAADTTLQSARWRFRTPRPDEDAAGEASYYPPDPRLGSALLADETLFRRRTTGGQYYFELRSYSSWRPWNGDRNARP
jgi:hypothetical protein